MKSKYPQRKYKLRKSRRVKICKELNDLRVILEKASLSLLAGRDLESSPLMMVQVRLGKILMDLLFHPEITEIKT